LPKGIKPDATRFEKIVAKLLQMNEKINQGREIQIVSLLKRLDMESDFMK
jgi:hypothetical protein